MTVDELMNMPMRDWPEELKGYVMGRSKDEAFCGDALYQWVVDWLEAKQKTTDCARADE